MANYSDDAALRGGFLITLVPSGAVLIVDTCSLSQPRNVIQRTDQNDAPAGQYVYDDFVTASLGVQINASADQRDYRGSTFTTADLTGDSRTWVVVGNSGAKNKGANVTYDLACNQVINPA